MTLCAVDFIEANFEMLFRRAMRKCGYNKELSYDAVSEAYISANDPDKLCKIYNDWWSINKVRDYIRSHWKKKRKEQDVLSFADWLDGKSTLPDFEKDIITKDYLDFMLHKVYAFVKDRYPQSQAKYTHYLEIWFYKQRSGDSWDTVKQNFSKANVNEVQARCTEILKEFRTYYLSKKGKYGIRRSPEDN